MAKGQPPFTISGIAEVIHFKYKLLCFALPKKNNNNKEDIKQNEIIHKPKGGVQALSYKFDDN